MNRHGLYWPTGRTLFRRGLQGPRRLALWGVSGAVLCLAALASIYIR